MDKKLMELKQAERSKTKPANTKRPKMELSKAARMIMLMTKVRQTHREQIDEHNNFLDMMKEARNGINKDLKIMKGLVEPEEPEKEIEDEVEEVVETNDTKLDINPNIEVVKRIKKTAKSKIDTGPHKPKVPKDIKASLHNSKGVQQVSKHSRKETSRTYTAKRPAFKV